MEKIITEQEFNTIKNSYDELIEEVYDYCGNECTHYNDSSGNLILKKLIELDKVTHIKIET